MLTLEQKELRRRGVAASEMGSLLDLNPWSGPIDVYNDKVLPITEDDAGSARTDWGHRLEDPIRKWYSDTLGVHILQPGTCRHPTDELAFATPDGEVYLPGGIQPINGLEIKSHTVNLQHLYGEPGTDDVPLWEIAQCGWNMYVRNIDRWHLVAFIDGLPRIYKIDRDPEFERVMIEARDRFWHDHVIPRRPPPPDGTKTYAAELARLWPANKSAELIQAGPEELRAIIELRRVRDQIWELGRAKARLEQTLKAAIQDRDGITWKDSEAATGSITWRRSRDGLAVDWEAVARDRSNLVELLASSVDTEHETLEEVVRRYTTVVPGSRRFVTPKSWAKSRPTDIDIDNKGKEQDDG